MSLLHYYILINYIFIVGLVGLTFNRSNFILIFVCIEILLLSINFYFMIFTIFFSHIIGQIYTLFILTVAAAEISIGLAMLVTLYRFTTSISIHQFTLSKY